MEYNPGCVAGRDYQHPVFAAPPVQNEWTNMSQYSMMAYMLPPQADQSYIQHSVVPPGPLDGGHGCHIPQLGQPVAYQNGGAIDPGLCLTPAVEVDVEELLEYQRRLSSVSAEEKEPLTPAQRRRKAQNRAAQRAFRDRKRQRVNDLEAQLSALESRTSSLESDNVRLKQELLITRNENDILRSIASTSAPNKSAPKSMQKKKRT